MIQKSEMAPDNVSLEHTFFLERAKFFVSVGCVLIRKIVNRTNYLAITKPIQM